MDRINAGRPCLRSDYQADPVFVECVDQLAKRRSNFHEDRISVDCVDQLAKRRSDFHANLVCIKSVDIRSIRNSARLLCNAPSTKQKTLSPSSPSISLPSGFSDFNADLVVSVECVDQLVLCRSNYHADRVSVKSDCEDQLAQRRSDVHADRVFVD